MCNEGRNSVCVCVCVCVERGSQCLRLVGGGGHIASSQQVSRLSCDPPSKLLQDLVKRWAQHSHCLDRQRLEAVAC